MQSCAYCDSLLADGALTCRGCGAPRRVHRRSVSPPPSGFVRWVDPWLGYSVHQPEGWVPDLGWPDAVRFRKPGAEVVVGRLAGHATATARDFAQSILQTFPPGEVQVARDEPQVVRVRIDAAPWQGVVEVRLAERGGLFVASRAQDGTAIEPLSEQVLGSLEPVEPVGRTEFVDPHESAFRVALPDGWTIQQTFSGMPGSRTPWCRLSADPQGRTFVACEADNFQVFADRPLEQPAQGGFFASVGRFMKQVDSALSGAVPMPFLGLGPAIEHHFVPQWIRAIPGSTYGGFDAMRADEAWATMHLPGGLVRVIRLEGARFPQLGADRWGALTTHYYQVPAEDQARLEPVLRGVARSFAVIPQWQQRERQRGQEIARMQAQQAQQQHQQWMQMSQQHHQQRMAGMQASMAAHNANWQAQQATNDAQFASWQAQQASSDAQFAGWQAQQASSDAGQRDFVNMIRGTADYAGGGEVVNTTEVDRLWSNQQGTYVGGDAGLEMGVDWIELKKL